MHGRNVYSKIRWMCRECADFSKPHGGRCWEVRASVTVYRIEKAATKVELYRLIPVNTYTSQVELTHRDVVDLGLRRQCISKENEKEITRSIMLDKLAELQYNLNNFMRGISA